MELSLLKYITLHRFINLIRIFSGYLLSIVLKKTFVWGMPLSVSIEPTNLCNLACPECPTGTGSLTRHKGNMSYSHFVNIVDAIHKECFYLQLFLQGEPFLNRELFRMIAYANEKNMYVVLSTNGQLIDEQTVDKILLNPPSKIIFSIDGINETMYSSYREGGSFEKAINGMRILSYKKKLLRLKNPVIEFQIILMKQNEEHLKETEAFAESNGADRVLFKSMQVSDITGARKYLPENPHYSRYHIIGNKIVLKKKLKNRCFALWRATVFTWDGRIVPCCFDKNADYELGIMNGKSIESIWKSGKYNSFRNQVLNNRKSIDICTNCSEGIKTDIYSSSL